MQKKWIILILLAFLVQCAPWLPNTGLFAPHTHQQLSDFQIPLVSIAIAQEAAEDALVISQVKPGAENSYTCPVLDQQKLLYWQAQQYVLHCQDNLLLRLLSHPTHNLPPPDTTLTS